MTERVRLIAVGEGGAGLAAPVLIERLPADPAAGRPHPVIRFAARQTPGARVLLAAGLKGGEGEG